MSREKAGPLAETNLLHDRMRSMEYARWDTLDGIRSTGYARWDTLDGSRSAECARWKQWNAHEVTHTMKSAWSKLHDGIRRTIDPLSYLHHEGICTRESAQGNLHNGIRTIESA